MNWGSCWVKLRELEKRFELLEKYYRRLMCKHVAAICIKQAPITHRYYYQCEDCGEYLTEEQAKVVLEAAKCQAK